MNAAKIETNSKTQTRVALQRSLSRADFLKRLGLAAGGAGLALMQRTGGLAAETGGSEVIVYPSWSNDQIQAALERYEVVKFAPGEYHLLHPNGWVGILITKSTRLLAADPRSKPSIIVDTGGDANGFHVQAPGSKVVIENLKFYNSGTWSNNVVTCASFELRGCEPVPAQGARAENFALALGPWGADCEIDEMTVAGNRLTPSIYLNVVKKLGRFNLIGNTLEGEGHVLSIDPPMWGGAQNTEYHLQNNSCTGGSGFVIPAYKSLTMINNEFTVDRYLSGWFASAFNVGSADPNSQALLVNNRIHLTLPAPAPIPEIPGSLQIVVPCSLGLGYYDVPIYNAVVNQLSVEGDCPVARAVQTYKAKECVIKNTHYSDLNILGPGTFYDYMTEAMLASVYGGDLWSIGVLPTAEYMCLNTESLILIDNRNPEARVTEWPTAGAVSFLGRMMPTRR